MVFAFCLHSINSSLKFDLVTQISLSLNVGKLWFNTTLSLCDDTFLGQWFDICIYQPLVYPTIVVHFISLLTFLPSYLIHSSSLSGVKANSFMVAILPYSLIRLLLPANRPLLAFIQACLNLLLQFFSCHHSYKLTISQTSMSFYSFQIFHIHN